MLTILLHSSKTMRPAEQVDTPYQAPALLGKSQALANYLASLSSADLQKAMQLSPSMAEKTRILLADWSTKSVMQRPAIDAFLGDIYSGLQVQSFSEADREYANDHLFILSGLYGVLRALDGIYPYRLEMGYRLPDEPYRNLYNFWNGDIAAQLPKESTVINLSAVEYTKAVLPHMSGSRIVTPKFLTISPKTGVPMFVTVHAKVARGAFARWLIQNRIDTPDDLVKFNDIGYSYNPALSAANEPVFVCQTFEGIGLSVRLT